MTDVHQVAIPHALREYALVADGERGALIGPQGHYAWMCFPSWDSPAVFTSLLGGRGDFQIAPADDRHVWGGYYEPRSLIWRSRWITGHTVVECRQALARPATPDRAVVLCRIESKRGRARVRATLDLRANFGRRAMTQVSRNDGVWSMRSGDVHARWAGAAGARHRDGEALVFEIDVDPGEFHDLVLELRTGSPGTGPLDAQLWEATESDWHASVPPCDDTVAPRDAQLAYAVLAGLTSSAGGMVAAATTSLPERSEAGRNYDYRYAWIRDQCFAAQAVAAQGVARAGRLDPGRDHQVQPEPGRLLAACHRRRPDRRVVADPADPGRARRRRPADGRHPRRGERPARRR